jgi:hypothetical protein
MALVLWCFGPSLAFVCLFACLAFNCFPYPSLPSFPFRNGGHPKFPPEKETFLIRAEIVGVNGLVVRDMESAHQLEKMQKERDKLGPEAGMAEREDLQNVKLHCAPAPEPDLVKKERMRVRVVFLGACHPKGHVPLNVANFVATKFAADWQKTLQKACDKFDP